MPDDGLIECSPRARLWRTVAVVGWVQPWGKIECLSPEIWAGVPGYCSNAATNGWMSAPSFDPSPLRSALLRSQLG